MLKVMFYTYLSLFFYYIGDVLSRIPFYWSICLYQKVMNVSVKLDDRAGCVVWKKV